jgi:hypothetical protein
MITGFGFWFGLACIMICRSELRIRAHVLITAAATAPIRTVTPEERHIVPGGHFVYDRVIIQWGDFIWMCDF